MFRSIFGVLAGLGGLTHGIGEVQQGNVAPDGFAIYSWTQGPIATHMLLVGGGVGPPIIGILAGVGVD